MEFELKVNKFDQSNRVYKVEGISPTLTCKTESNIERVVYSDKEGYKVRKLTPLECWRLMSFSDEDYYKAKNEGISNSQLYKQAGNSIVVKVLEGIFESLFLYKDKAENETKITTVKLENKVEKYEQIKWVI
jgi:DNA (cytosine-5)-methyltransferase 1